MSGTGLFFFYLGRVSNQPIFPTMIRLLRSLLLITALGLWACTTTYHDKAEEVFQEGRKHILLMHPTVQNLERFLYLTGEGIFPLPDDYRVVGVYHQNATYDYGRSARYILNEELGDMALFAIDAPLNEHNIYGRNAGTDIFQELFERSEGAFFLGGPDIPPATYGEEFNLLTVVTDPHRHYLELSFLYHLLGGSQDPGYLPLLKSKPDYVILGICLGMQTMNVAAGGSLYQDIPTQVYEVHTVEEVVAMEPDKQHRNYYTYYRIDPEVSTPTFHRIHTISGSHMALAAGEANPSPYVLSSHHQAVKEFGQGYRATAWSADGQVVEAMEHENYPHVVGIQFHPEVPYLYDPDHKILFRPGHEATDSFLDLYPGELGEDFHRNFWVHVAGMFP